MSGGGEYRVDVAHDRRLLRPSLEPVHTEQFTAGSDADAVEATVGIVRAHRGDASSAYGDVFDRSQGWDDVAGVEVAGEVVEVEYRRRDDSTDWVGFASSDLDSVDERFADGDDWWVDE